MKTNNFKNMFDAARNESAPCVDVTDRVMATLHHRTGRRHLGSQWGLVAYSAVSIMAAIGAVAYAVAAHVPQPAAVDDLMRLVTWVTIP